MKETERQRVIITNNIPIMRLNKANDAHNITMQYHYGPDP